MDPQEQLTPSSATAAARLPFSDAQLVAFLLALGREGYPVGAGEVVAARLLLERLEAAGLFPGNPRELARWLGPLLCATAGQQREFRRRFDVWIGPLLEPRPSPKPELPRPFPAPPPTHDAPLEEELRALRRRTWIVRATLTLLFLAAAALVYVRRATFVAGSARVAVEPRRLPTVSAGALLYAAVPLALVAAVLLLRRRFLVRRYASDPPDVSRFAVSDVTTSAWLPPVPRDVAVRMRRREVLEDDALDVQRTVEACAEAAGRFTPVYATRTRIPEYLVLIDRTSPNDLRALRAAAIVEQLAGDGVYAAVYYFDGDPRRVLEARRGAQPLPLTELQSRHPGRRLIVCAEADSLVSDLTGLPYRWVSLFDQWSDRSLLTLVPMADWGVRERAVSSVGFKVLPCTPDGFGAVADPRLARRVSGDARFLQPPRYPQTLSADEMAWMDPNRPPAQEMNRMLGEVRRYLGETGYTWLAACAVYPETNPTLTLHLGRQVAQPYQASIVERLARLPWLRRGHMPDWLRRTLLEDLRGARERSVRAVLRALLLSPRDAPDDEALEVARNQGGQLGWLWRWRSRGWRDQLPPGEPLRDHVFVTWMDNRLALRIPRALLRWLHRRGRERPHVSADTLTPDTAHYFEVQPAFPARGLVALARGMAFAAGMGGVYGALTHGSGVLAGLLGGISFFVAFFAMTGVVRPAIRSGHVRGRAYGAVVGLLLASVFLYANWVVWIAREPGLSGNMVDPRVMLARLPEPGALDYLMWRLETLFFVLLGWGIGVRYATKPFCPTCQQWVTQHDRVYAPLADEVQALGEILRGRYTPVFALSTTAPSAARATLAQLEHCHPACGAVTLISLKTRHSDRAGGMLRSVTTKPLVERLFVPRHAARAVYEWVVATKSIRLNLAPEDQPALHQVVEALIDLPQRTGNFYLYGDIPVKAAAKARERLRLSSDVDMAALIVSEGWFIVEFYNAYVFTSYGIYAHYKGKTQLTPYSAFTGLDSSSSRARKSFLDEHNIGFAQSTVTNALLGIITALGLAEGRGNAAQPEVAEV